MIFSYASEKISQLLKIKERLQQAGAHERLLGPKKIAYNDEKSIIEYFHAYKKTGQTTSLDVGSGPIPRNPFDADECYGADLRENSVNNVIFTDLASGRLPFGDSTFDYVTAYDVLEHIPRINIENGVTKFPFIFLLNEVFRTLKNGGVFFSIQPCYPAKEAFQDPTHVNIMSEDTINLYFCERAWARIYGFSGSFCMLIDGWHGCKYFSFIQKSAETPIIDLNFVQK